MKKKIHLSTKREGKYLCVLGLISLRKEYFHFISMPVYILFCILNETEQQENLRKIQSSMETERVWVTNNKWKT